ncbi:hypothetical protein AB6N23_17035 [Cellulomonas sp. 179-A 9B4 NHS]|uniref:hypothetical protein n=1 Tax=Cellulomonas sp. 179-A 9B4 NHS TaxID=3142379 RepID=UPI00399FD765
MGRHAGGGQPPAPWPRRLGRAVLRWAGRAALGAVTGAVVLVVLGWAGITGTSARALAAGAGVLVVVAAALAATVPAPAPHADGPPGPPPRGSAPGPRSDDR